MGVSQNGWFVREHPIKIDDLGVLLFQETCKWMRAVFCCIAISRKAAMVFVVCERQVDI